MTSYFKYPDSLDEKSTNTFNAPDKFVRHSSFIYSDMQETEIQNARAKKAELATQRSSPIERNIYPDLYNHSSRKQNNALFNTIHPSLTNPDSSSLQSGVYYPEYPYPHVVFPYPLYPGQKITPNLGNPAGTMGFIGWLYFTKDIHNSTLLTKTSSGVPYSQLYNTWIPVGFTNWHVVASSSQLTRHLSAVGSPIFGKEVSGISQQFGVPLGRVIADIIPHNTRSGWNPFTSEKPDFAIIHLDPPSLPMFNFGRVGMPGHKIDVDIWRGSNRPTSSLRSYLNANKLTSPRLPSNNRGGLVIGSKVTKISPNDFVGPNSRDVRVCTGTVIHIVDGSHYSQGSPLYYESIDPNSRTTIGLYQRFFVVEADRPDQTQPNNYNHQIPGDSGSFVFDNSSQGIIIGICSTAASYYAPYAGGGRTGNFWIVHFIQDALNLGQSSSRSGIDFSAKTPSSITLMPYP